MENLKNVKRGNKSKQKLANTTLRHLKVTKYLTFLLELTLMRKIFGWVNIERKVQV